MKIKFFETEKGLDNRAVKGGVYQIELMGAGGQRVPLYIGESVWIAGRCGQHLYALYNNPSYFGLTPDDLDDENLSLVFRVLDKFKEEKNILGVDKCKELELEYIKENKPVTQLNTSDKQIRNVDERIKRVQDELIRVGIKA